MTRSLRTFLPPAFAALALTVGLAGFAVSCEAGPPAVPAVTVPPVQPAHTAVPATPPLTVVAYTVPPRVTGKQPEACVARANGMLPDPACTPGSVGSTDAGEVCKPGFSDAHRPSPARMRQPKTTAMLTYRVPVADRARTEYDHLVPLSLGGSNDVSNLWPQVSDLSLVDERNSKDKLETRIWRWVCTAPVEQRQKRLADAQAAFARQWTGAEKFLGLSPA